VVRAGLRHCARFGNWVSPGAVRYHRVVPRYHVQNFGCRATQADGAALEHQFEERGLIASAMSEAEVVVLNTCTVTAAADQDARAAIRRIKRNNPKAQIVVTGCYAQRAPQEIAALPGVSAVIGNSHKHQLAELVLGQQANQVRGFGECDAFSAANADACAERALGPEAAFVPLANLSASPEKPGGELEPRFFVSDIFAHSELLAAPVFEAPNERTRPNLKIQDGCDNRCSFCVIPYVRGQSRSLRPEQIIAEVNSLVASGYREVVLSGINLGRWGRDLDLRLPASSFSLGASRFSKPNFENLIRAILDQTHIEKLRISSVEPMDWSDDLIELVATSPRIAQHAHVPMQSGSDAVLRRMYRKYRPWHYREKIEKIRAALRTAAIGADVMVGFPGENDAEFQATRRMIEELPFTYLHVFTYSPRPGTPAAALPNQVPVQVARERNRILRELAAAKKSRFMQSFVGKAIEAITLKSAAEAADSPVNTSPYTPAAHEFTECLTDNYLPLRLGGQHEPNRWLRARVEAADDGGLIGSLT
jgi:threonylcarbamoyladenosine tRNA methylthiotransferase MtaB